MSLNYVTLTVDVYDGQGNVPISGTATFTPSAVLTDTTNDQIIAQLPVTVSFKPTGVPTVRLLATDNATALPAGWAWSVTFSGTSMPAAFSFFLPFSGGASQNLADLTAVATPSALLGGTAAGVSVYPSGDTTGVTDQANITAAEALGRTIYLGPGTFWVTGLVKQSFTYWQGAGIGATFLKLAAGANTDVVQGAGFTGLTMSGTSTWGASGIWDWGIAGLTIDGNASNQSGTSYGLRVYGYQWTLRDLAVRNCLTDGIWTEWGALGSDAPVTSEGSESTAFNVRVSWNGRHGWSHLGPSDCRIGHAIIFKNNATAAAAGIGFWALKDQVSNICRTASGMNGTTASGFTGTFTVQAAALGGATDLYATTGTLAVTTSTGTATMTYTGKTATTFTGCTVTAGSGVFQTGNAVTTSGTTKFTSNGLQTTACHSWSNNHTWAAVFDSQVSDSGSHWEGAQYGQVLARSAAIISGGSVYDLSTIETGCGIQLGDDGTASGVPLSASITANSCDIRTRAVSFMNDTAARAALNWVSATQSSADIQAVTKTTGTFATTIAAGSNGVDLSTFTGGSPGTLNVASTQSIPNGAGTLTVATSNGNQTATYTGTNGSNGGTRSSGTQFTGVVGVTVPGGSVMSTGGAVSLQNLGSLAIGGNVDASSRVRVQAQSSTTALSTGASSVREFGTQTLDTGSGANAFRVRVNGSDRVNVNTSSSPPQFQLPNGVVSRWYSDNYVTKLAEVSGSNGIASFAAAGITGLTGAVTASRYAGATASGAPASGTFLTGDLVADLSGKIWICTAGGTPGTWVSVAPAGAASVSLKPSNPTATTSASVVCMGIGSTCAFTPLASGKVVVTVCGSWLTATSAVQGAIGARYGTGTAPVNGAADTGTAWGTNATTENIRAAGTGGGLPFAFTERLTLTPSTAYWFDLVTSTTNAADAATITNIVMTLQELPA